MFPRFVIPASDLIEAQYYEALRRQQLIDTLAAIQYQQEIEEERQRRRRIYEQRVRQQQQRENAQRALNALLFNLPAVQQYFYEEADEEEEEEEEPVIEIVVKRPQRSAAQQQQKRVQPQQTAKNVTVAPALGEKQQIKPVQTTKPAAATASASKPAGKPKAQPQTAPRKTKLVVQSNESQSTAPVEVPITVKKAESKSAQPIAEMKPEQEHQAPRRIKIPIFSSEDEKQTTAQVASAVEANTAVAEAKEAPVEEAKPSVDLETSNQETSDIVIHLNPVTEQVATESTVPSEATTVAEAPAPQPSLVHDTSSLPGDVLIVINETPEVPKEEASIESAVAQTEQKPSETEEAPTGQQAPSAPRFEKEQSLLHQIGFNETKLNEELLIQFNGDVKQVVNALLKM